MAITEHEIIQPTSCFEFRGTTQQFGRMCFINTLLTLITLGIYLPWATIKTRRYFYQNLSLNGYNLSQHAANRITFISWSWGGLFFYLVTLFAAIMGYNVLLSTLWVLVLLMPIIVLQIPNEKVINDSQLSFSSIGWQSFSFLVGLPIMEALLAEWLSNRSFSWFMIFFKVAITGLSAFLLMRIINSVRFSNRQHLLNLKNTFAQQPIEYTLSMSRRRIFLSTVMFLLPAIIAFVLPL